MERRAPSGGYRLGLADCPHCKATGVEPPPEGFSVTSEGTVNGGTKCTFCGGAKRVELSRFNTYIGLK